VVKVATSTETEDYEFLLSCPYSGLQIVEGIAQNGLPMVMPSYISDVRIANGKITLYKSVR